MNAGNMTVSTDMVIHGFNAAEFRGHIYLAKNPASSACSFQACILVSIFSGMLKSLVSITVMLITLKHCKLIV